MPGDVGLVAKVVEAVFSWATDEDGLKELVKRRSLKNKKEECRRALLDNRWDDLQRLTNELRDLSSKP